MSTPRLINRIDDLPETIEELVQFLELNRQGSRYTDSDNKLIWQAYSFARSAHADQRRESGESYIFHPLAVAQILIELGLDIETIIAAILHDVAEDTEVSLDQITEQFGENVATLVDGVTKLSKYDIPDRERRDAEGIRKLFLAMISDVRVILIKLADRLHNIRTIDSLPDERRRKIASETLEIYAPIAERLGIWRIKSELEDHSFKILEPKLYSEISKGVEKSRDMHEEILEKIVATISKKLISNGFSPENFEVTGRSKHVYSIYKKMRTPKYEGKGVERIYDKLGIRIILKSVPECYATLGMIHSEWPPIPGEFDDFIGMRLPSGYQSLHTSVKYGTGKDDVVEFQIRTEQMHFDAEYGVAAHWKYKEKDSSRRDKSGDKGLDLKVAWLRQMVDEPQPDDPESFVALLKADVLQELVYVFTPKGDIVELPNGCTPIDYAYHIHTDIGHRCRGAKVNGKLVPLDYVLKTGDQVEILTTRQGGPSRDWLNSNLGLVKSQRARSKIRQWFKRQARDQNISQGKTMLEKELRRLGLGEINFERLAKELDFRSVDQLFEGIGCGDLPIGKLVNYLTVGEKEESVQEYALVSRPSTEAVTHGGEAVSVLGLKGLLTTMARCCNPAAGDAIVGYITRGRGATIHRQDCPNVLRIQDRERLVRVSWGEVKRTYPVPVRMKAYDRNGLMKDISTLISDEGINMTDIKVNVNRNLAVLDLVIEVPDIAKLSRVLDRLENLPNVMEARRIQPG